MPYPAGFESMVLREYLVKQGVRCGPAEVLRDRLQKNGVRCGEAKPFDLFGAWGIPILKDDGNASFMLPVVGVLKYNPPLRYRRWYSWVVSVEYHFEGQPSWKSHLRFWPHPEDVFIGLYSTLYKEEKREQSSRPRTPKPRPAVPGRRR